MEKEEIEELFESFAYDCSGNVWDDGLDTDEDPEPALVMELEEFTQAINHAELELYKKLLAKLEFIYGSDLKVFSTIIDKNANNYYKEIQDKIKELENGQ